MKFEASDGIILNTVSKTSKRSWVQPQAGSRPIPLLPEGLHGSLNSLPLAQIGGDKQHLSTAVPGKRGFKT